MSTNDIVKQLRAVEKCFPVHRYATKHIRIAENPMMVAFVRMAGESRPWGIVFGRLQDKAPKVLIAPDGRNRKAVEEICEEFAGVLLKYCRAEGQTFNPIRGDNIEPDELPQIWVPGERHVEMFHHLEYAYWRVRKGDDRTSPLTTFARLSGWIFRESNRKGQQQIIDASRALRDHFVFPTDTASLGNLTSVNAWFSDEKDLKTKRLQVRKAGDQRVSPTLDPSLDYQVLAPLLEERAMLMDKGQSLDAVERKIRNAIEPELMARWDALIQGFEILANDTLPENTGVEKLVRKTMESFVNEFQRVELGILGDDENPTYTPHPETDYHGSAAAANYFKMSSADNAYIAHLIHDDKELQAASLKEGRSFLARVAKVEDRGEGRKTIPIWTLEVKLDEVLRLREGERYSLLLNPNSVLLVRTIEYFDDLMQVEVEWSTPKTKPAEGPLKAVPKDLVWTDQHVLLVPSDASELDEMSVRAVWSARKGIGAWLTHGKAPTQSVDNIVDDITQLQG